MTQEPQVLVVGAGPVGLTMACELTRHGVPCRVVDGASGPAGESRALAVHSRTLELWEDQGVLDQALARGHRMHGLNLYQGAQRLAHMTLDELDAPFPFILSLPQAETERLLLAQLEELGGSVEWATALTQLTQDKDGVHATLSLPDGQEQPAPYPWLVGCDGARSTVRKALGFEFGGSTYEERLLLADLELEWGLPRDEGHVFFSPQGLLAAFPLPGERTYRLVAQVEEEELPEPTLEWFQETLESRGPGGTVSNGTWFSSFRIHRRMVDRYREGHVFLAGDAAHIHSPVGGQGMNTGIQDAYNLAWKLALVVRGRGKPELLDSYQAERLPVARATLEFTHNATRMVMLRHVVGQQVRNKLVGFLSGLEFLRRRAATNASELGINYRNSPLVQEDRSSLLLAHVKGSVAEEHPSVREWLEFGAAPRPGDRAPDAGFGGWRLFQAIRGTAHHLFLFDGAAPTLEGYQKLTQIAASAQGLVGEELLQAHLVVPSSERPIGLDDWAGGIVFDPEGILHARYGAGAECLYLIRPDGYVAYRAQPAEWEPLLRYLERVFC